MFEGTVSGKDSYLLMFDPKPWSNNNSIEATVTFSGSIFGFQDTTAELAGTEGSIYQKSDVT